ncbi:molybdopterin molybdotransferase MoeA [Tuwongella immobilis]|uniref:Molybdopterin molybdenumtransferase n=1 Tax=Tuwongella immobilis TaxID=692036 RepID=A0A6C2YI43_9BACT|nr:gephyrin-like molybdotransferase Glp [Tuwongella immobilis]VIP01097.1 molybdenum cofactor synthesis domain protein : Molybdenum cofactor synthesis domain protein OS=Singulisphaera acidiphila (strain ATCC BAA-1392 / DSM 18658 / VKM B-2454 / MOB10) GN=Sinac_6558 PE=4 SV=1: MoeA_N: MoCF_biosynth: MoeA_C [Tuwongella immobilis]VTR97619.1 molybdenum cofactor synthesis domain protein : Molybdenum cofactor synthesis domain protein OS=Singulisphaera acidiphila (strain ATCC BAA-1392 / DSM 18658 / VKM B-
MLSVAAAREQILANVVRQPPEIGALTSSLLGSVLAEPVTADMDSPPFDKAMMDGFAVRSADCGQFPVTLTIVEEVPAGKSPMLPVGPGQATRIMTGAPIPEGADAVVQVERTEQPDSMHVTLLNGPVTPRQHILDRGREMRAGDVVMPAGQILRAAEYGLFATVGKTAVPVFRSPKVSLLCTGDEVVEANMKRMGSQIRNSNGPMLVMQTVRAGGLPRYLGIAPDRVDVLRSQIREGIDGGEVLVMAGGVSMGMRDLVPEVLADLGVQIHFHKVAMKPGKPLLFGTKGHKLIFGLPGNPVSSFVGFELFVRPALAAMRGVPTTMPKMARLPLAADFRASSDRELYYPAKLEIAEVGFAARPVPWFGSADLRAITAADCLLKLPAGETALTAGQIVDVILTDA